MTDFRPQPGLDPAMREYKCSSCKHEWYHIPKTSNRVEPSEETQPLLT